MAEINAAYQELRDPEKRRLHREAGAHDPRNGRDAEGPFGGYTRPYPDPTRPGWGARPRPARPVTARIDTSALLRPRNSTLRPLDRSPLPGLPPRPRAMVGHEPPRASDPTGPMRRHRGPVMDGDLPTLTGRRCRNRTDIRRLDRSDDCPRSRGAAGCAGCAPLPRTLRRGQAPEARHGLSARLISAAADRRALLAGIP
jgi:hypothetical protein